MNLLINRNKFVKPVTLAYAEQVRRENASALAKIAEADATLATRLIDRELRLPSLQTKEEKDCTPVTSFTLFRGYVDAYFNKDSKRMDVYYDRLSSLCHDKPVTERINGISPHLSVLKNAINTYDDAMKLDTHTRDIHLSSRNNAAYYYAEVCLIVSTALCDFLKKSRKGEAVNLLQSALELSPKSPFHIWGLVQASMSGKFSQADALRASDAVSRLAVHPASKQDNFDLSTTASFWNLSGDLLCLCGNTELARQQYGKAQAVNPSSVGAIIGFALCDVAENNFEGAKAKLQSALAANSTSAHANIVLAKIAKLEGNVDEAISYANKAAEGAKFFEEFYAANLLLAAWLFEKNDKSFKHHFIVARGRPRSDNLPRQLLSPNYIGALAILNDKFEASILAAEKSMFHVET